MGERALAGRVLPDSALEVNQRQLELAPPDMKAEAIYPVGINRIEDRRLADAAKPPAQLAHQSVPRESIDRIDDGLEGDARCCREFGFGCLTEAAELCEDDALLEQPGAHTGIAALVWHPVLSPQRSAESAE